MKKNSHPVDDLRDIIRHLRGPQGCPWDRKQTPEKVKDYLTEELYELIEAVDEGCPELLAEETGDIVFMILFLVNLYEEKQVFTLEQALAKSKKKMIHRHPHVFGDVEVDSAEQVLENWQNLKVQEGKKPKKSLLDGIPAGLPALTRARFLTEKAANVCFDWDGPAAVMEKLAEELGELRDALKEQNSGQAAEEIGDLLFSAVNLARHLGIDPEQALRRSNEKFYRRFTGIEQELQRRGSSVQEATLEEMDAIWEKVKKREAKT